MIFGRKITAVGFFTLYGVAMTHSADLPTAYSEIPVPPLEQSETGNADQKGIWAAIAYSEGDGKYGFFWGADKRIEAEKTALQHCVSSGGKSCSVVTVFRNHRHWGEHDGSGVPYNHCGALAVSKKRSGDKIGWGAESAPTRIEAEKLSLSTCEVNGAQCEIKEWVCT